MKKAIEERNKQRLIDECHTGTGDQRTLKTKTAFIMSTLEEQSYERKPLNEVALLSKQETKALIIARYGMLECGKNFKGTMSHMCDTCNVVDDEEHRLNRCTKFSNLNFCNEPVHISFDTLFSNDIGTIKMTINRIQ